MKNKRWYHGKQITELPKYLKNKTDHVFKIDTYIKGEDGHIYAHYNHLGCWNKKPLAYFTPATKEEFIEYYPTTKMKYDKRPAF